MIDAISGLRYERFDRVIAAIPMNHCVAICVDNNRASQASFGWSEYLGKRIDLMNLRVAATKCARPPKRRLDFVPATLALVDADLLFSREPDLQ